MFVKRDNCFNIKQVVERNTGISAEEFTSDVRNLHIKNIKESVTFVKEYIKNNPDSEITIVGDYDSDGINATTILTRAFKMYGITVKTRLPKRFSEGYGLSVKIIDEIDSGLVITVDNGIAAIDAIKKAKDKGLSVVIIDHHMPVMDKDEKTMILPDADIIVDPHIENESEFKDYCGAALAYHFAKELLPDKKLKDLLILASIATVSDVMPLIGPNRTMVKDGLEYINKGLSVPGLQSLINAMSLGNHITESTYGFKIGPAFNAPGRLYDNGAEKGLALLLSTRNDPKIKFRAKGLNDINEKRKNIVKKTIEVIDATTNFDSPDEFSFDINVSESRKPIVYYNNSIGEGIIGIIAGRLCENEQCPVIVFTDSSNQELLKGSGRSTKDIHLKKCLDKMKDVIVGYGGHAGAAGLSIKKTDLNKFIERFNEVVGPLPSKITDVYYDLDLEENDNLEDILKELKTYSPYGEGNPELIFKITSELNSKTYNLMGKEDDKNHFSIESMNGKIKFVAFDMVKKYEELGKPNKIEAVGHLTEHWFNEKKTIKFEIIDFDKA